MQMSRAKGRGRGAGAEPMMDEGQGVARSRTECIKEIHVLPVLTYVSCGSRSPPDYYQQEISKLALKVIDYQHFLPPW